MFSGDLDRDFLRVINKIYLSGKIQRILVYGIGFRRFRFEDFENFKAWHSQLGVVALVYRDAYFGDSLNDYPTVMGRPCSLVVGQVDNTVAIGTIFERISTDGLVYRVRLEVGDIWVFVELACDSHSLLPIPIIGIIYSVHDAIGSHVPWPKHLL
uniref:DUF8039 domain-containing protein n=1 Tax=Cucumis melo TaxID=3656 RepID=A0A9I9EIA4_CUCME